MEISPIFTLQVGDDKYISCDTEVSVTSERCVDNYAVQIFSGLFTHCDEDGMYIEVGEEESIVIYIEFCEIVEIEQR